MKMAEKYELLQMSNRIWLMDLANAIQLINKTYFVLYMKQANNTKKALSSEYHKVATELQEAFQNLSKAIPITVKGNAFNTDYAGESKEDTLTTKVQKGRENSSFHSQKRAETNLTEKTSSKKLKNSKCLAYNIRGHTLPDCWYLFKGKRLKGFKAIGTHIKRVLTKVEHDKDLAAQVEQLKLKELNANEA